MRPLNGNFAFVKSIPLAFAILLMLFAGMALAKVDECQPDGMPDAEATRIIAIATAQGKAFRAAIDAIRAGGVSYETDTSYDDLMADPERALALAKERYFGMGKPISPEYLRSSGISLDKYIETNFNHWVHKKNTNLFSAEVTAHLRSLIIALGGRPIISQFRYKINANVYVFALGSFVKGAELKYHSGRHYVSPAYKSVHYSFFEKLALHNRRPNFETRVFLSTNLTESIIIFESAYFGDYDTFKNGWPILKRANKNCLTTFTKVEE